ncbi:hypothetical protein EKL95_12150 [Flavobacterium sp. LB2P53]|nr:hypothetical protein EKL95_12150 [Flavobacterium sp. LB2P53]
MIKVTVVGNGMLGYKFFEKFIAKPGQEKHQITVFGEESRRTYDSVHLCKNLVQGQKNKRFSKQ